MSNTNFVCQGCNTELASLVCQCTSPAVLLCFRCLETHLRNDPSLSHTNTIITEKIQVDLEKVSRESQIKLVNLTQMKQRFDDLTAEID
jgi:hypothetical protein